MRARLTFCLLETLLGVFTIGMGIGVIGMFIRTVERGRYRSEYLLAAVGGLVMVYAGLRLIIFLREDFLRKARAEGKEFDSVSE